MYLLRDSRLSAVGAHRLTPTLIQGRRRAFLSLIHSFCVLIHKVESAPGHAHKLSGRFSSWRRLVRRNVDFLLTCLLNASSWQKEVPSEYGATVDVVKKVLRSPPRTKRLGEGAQLRLTSQQALRTKFAGFPSVLNCRDENSVARRFSQSFANCADKDSLQIIQERGETASYFSFLDPDVPTIQLESLPISTRSGRGEFFESVHRERGEEETAAAAKIHNMWETRYPIVQKRREFFETPCGREIFYIGKLCKEVVERMPLHLGEIIARRAVLFDRGPSLYRYCKETEKKYNEVKRVLVFRRKAKAAGNQSVMQAFQCQLDTLLAISTLTKRAGILDETNWENLRVASGVLNEKITEALEGLRAINHRLEMIMGKNFR